jgi:hypothetical protein
MRYIIAVLGFILVLIVMWDAFETIISPRRITSRFRFARFFYRVTWWSRSDVAQRIKDEKRRETYLSMFGPLSLLVLLSVWAIGLVVGFAMLHWGLKLRMNVPNELAPFSTYLYMSGTTFFTLGLGDVTPLGLGRAVVAVEAGLGFGFLAANISYLPMLYQAYSRREVSILLLDERAGSPPSAGELLRRHRQDMPRLEQLLYEWERWSAEVLESHLSYPCLAYFRSQHTNQSWLAALTTILDACALVMAGVDGGPTRQAKLTFAMTRHATIDLAQLFISSPRPMAVDRLPRSDFTALQNMLAEEGVTLEVSTEQKLRDLRQMYEPYVEALSEYFSMPLPPWFSVSAKQDKWQASPWEEFLTSMQHSTHPHEPELMAAVQETYRPELKVVQPHF